MERTERNSGRVVFVDQEDRALLQLVLDEARGTTFWLTTGGGVDRGESVIDAAIREAFEETGYVLERAVLSAPVALVETEWSFRGVDYAGLDTVYFVRVESFDVDPSGLDEIERVIIKKWQWWSADDLEATTERIEPTELPALLRHFLANGVPSEPFQLVSLTPPPHKDGVAVGE